MQDPTRLSQKPDSHLPGPKKIVLVLLSAVLCWPASLYIAAKHTAWGQPLDVFQLMAPTVVVAFALLASIKPRRLVRYVRGTKIMAAAEILTLAILLSLIVALTLAGHVTNRGRLTWFAHAFSVGSILLAIATLWAAHRKIVAKTRNWGIYIQLQQQLIDSSPWYLKPLTEINREECANQINTLLHRLTLVIDAPSANIVYHLARRYMDKPRLVSVWLPTEEGHFRCAFYSPRPPEKYGKVVGGDYRPSIHHEQNWQKMLSSWRVGGSAWITVPPGEEENFADQKADVTSLFGALWADKYPPPEEQEDMKYISIDDVRDVPVTDAYYDPALAEFAGTRSIYVRTLRVARHKLGLLVILDPLREGFSIRDEDHLEGYAHLLELSLARYTRYQAIQSPMQLSGGSDEDLLSPAEGSGKQDRDPIVPVLENA